jgi:hypothetical protein
MQECSGVRAHSNSEDVQDNNFRRCTKGSGAHRGWMLMGRAGQVSDQRGASVNQCACRFQPATPSPRTGALSACVLTNGTQTSIASGCIQIAEVHVLRQMPDAACQLQAECSSTPCACVQNRRMHWSRSQTSPKSIQPLRISTHRTSRARRTVRKHIALRNSKRSNAFARAAAETVAQKERLQMRPLWLRASTSFRIAPRLERCVLLSPLLASSGCQEIACSASTACLGASQTQTDWMQTGSALVVTVSVSSEQRI